MIWSTIPEEQHKLTLTFLDDFYKCQERAGDKEIMSTVERVTRKSMIIRPSGRSTDYIAPSFGHGCLYN